MTDVDPKLRQRLANRSDDPYFTVSVIVTLGPGVDAATLLDLGMIITGSTHNSPFVFGTLDSVVLDRIETHDSVSRVELDQDRAHTLDDPGH